MATRREQIIERVVDEINSWPDADGVTVTAHAAPTFVRDPDDDDAPTDRATKSEFVSGGNPDALFHVPNDGMFESDGSGFLPAPELEEVAGLVAQHYTRLRHLTGYEIRLVWRRKGGRFWGKPQLASGLLKHFSEADAVVWVSAERLRDWQPSALEVEALEVEALVYHLLRRIGFDEESEKLVLEDPDVVAFNGEITAYGGKLAATADGAAGLCAASAAGG